MLSPKYFLADELPHQMTTPGTKKNASYLRSQAQEAQAHILFLLSWATS